MSRYKSAGSYGHRIQKLAYDHYRISWVVDRYYEGVRGRFARTCSRDTDETGASRFKKRWNITAAYALPPVISALTPEQQAQALINRRSPEPST